MAERRYSRYKLEDVCSAYFQLDDALYQRLNVRMVERKLRGGRTTRIIKDESVEYRAVLLARSSDWYKYSLNCVEVWHHDVNAIVAGTHDSCTPVPVLAIDNYVWYEPLEMRSELEADFDGFRKTQYGHNMFIGALMCGEEWAKDKLQGMKKSTRLRIESELKLLRQRRPGRPIDIGLELGA